MTLCAVILANNKSICMRANTLAPSSLLVLDKSKGEPCKYEENTDEDGFIADKSPLVVAAQVIERENLRTFPSLRKINASCRPAPEN